MTRKFHFCFAVILLVFLATACSDNKESKSEKKETSGADTGGEKEVAGGSSKEIEAPDFKNPELKQYYALYTAYLIKVVTAIQNNDEAATMKLFTEEGKQFSNRDEMETKARADDEGKFRTWLVSTMPHQAIIVKSDYYKKFNEAYYKKVKEDFEKKNY